jgi:hypothetical protein
VINRISVIESGGGMSPLLGVYIEFPFELCDPAGMQSTFRAVHTEPMDATDCPARITVGFWAVHSSLRSFVIVQQIEVVPHQTGVGTRLSATSRGLGKRKRISRSGVLAATCTCARRRHVLLVFWWVSCRLY